MRSLHDVQQSFATDLRSGQTRTLGRDIVAGAFPGERLLQVYRNNTYLSLTDALACSFPVVARLVGDGFFGFMAHAYIDAHPSTEGSLHRFGAKLAGFIETFKPARELPYLADVARLEWAWEEVFHEQDHPPFAPETLAGVPSERYGELRFRLHPATRLLESPFPIASIWEVNQDHRDGEQSVDLQAGAEHLLVSRQGLEVSVHRLDRGAYRLLKSLGEGRPLEGALGQADDPNLDLDAWLQRWVALGIIVEATL